MESVRDDRGRGYHEGVFLNLSLLFADWVTFFVSQVRAYINAVLRTDAIAHAASIVPFAIDDPNRELTFALILVDFHRLTFCFLFK